MLLSWDKLGYSEHYFSCVIMNGTYKLLSLGREVSIGAGPLNFKSIILLLIFELRTSTVHSVIVLTKCAHMPKTMIFYMQSFCCKRLVSLFCCVISEFRVHFPRYRTAPSRIPRRLVSSLC